MIGWLATWVREALDPARWSLVARRCVTLALCVVISGSVFYTFCFHLQTLAWTPLEVLTAALYYLLLFFGSVNLVLYVFGSLQWRSSRRDAEQDSGGPITARTAIVMPIYHEEPADVYWRVRATWLSCKGEGLELHCDFYLLCDSTDSEICRAEEAAYERLQADFNDHDAESGRLFLVRRDRREKYKAGNIAHFLEQYGEDYDFMLVLDADSVMAGKTIRRMIARLQGRPDAGLIQSTVLPIRAMTPFARSLEYSTRRCMPLYARGLNWFLGRDSVYWGHNALLRIEPFMRFCNLPVMPGKPPLGGDIMSQDIVEAALLGRAGWAVEWDTDPEGSFDELPANVLSYGRRDRRWCQGNFQHFWLIFGDRMRLGHRLYFANGILAYSFSLLILLLVALGFVRVMSVDDFQVDGRLFGSFVAFLAFIMLFPRVLGLIHIAKSRSVHRAREVISTGVEFLFSLLVAPLLFWMHSVFIVGILTGKVVRWETQSRSTGEGLPWAMAVRVFGLPTVLGVGATVAAVAHDGDFPWFLAPILFSWVFSIPIAVWISHPRLGEWLVGLGLFPSGLTEMEHALLARG